MTIKQKQHLLAYLGYYVGNIDGDWGTLCKTATKAFQKDFGLAADGVCGEKTEKALKHSVAYGIVKKSDSTDNNTNVQNGSNGDNTLAFWDDIKYFRKSEFSCKCGCGADEMDEMLIRCAVKVREHFGKPVTVSSGRRCVKHNVKVGGVSNSRHLSGKAMDFCVSGFSASIVLPYVQSLSGIRYAYSIDGNFVHMDVN